MIYGQIGDKYYGKKEKKLRKQDWRVAGTLSDERSRQASLRQMS